MTKRKKPEGNDPAGDQSVPIPIQTFLWRQTRYDSNSGNDCVIASTVYVKLLNKLYCCL